MALTDEAIEQIRGLIRSGALPPGARLPPENELATQLGLSRNSMREAVKALELVRVLDVRRGDGTYVTSLEPRLLLEGLGLAVELLQDDSILSVVEVRRLLEPAATGLAAERITDDGLHALETRLDEMEAAGTDAERQVAADAAFHLDVFAATRNQTLLSVLDGLSSLTLRARIWRAVVEADAISETLHEHRVIFAALEARDRPLAEAAALIHVNTSETWLRSVVVAEADAHIPGLTSE